MSEENQSFKLYQKHTYEKWRKTIGIASSIIAVIILCIEIGMFFVLKADKERTDVNGIYITIRIVVPTLLNLSALLISLLITKNKKTSVQTKNLFSTLSFLVICSVIAIFHNFFQVLMICPAFCFFLGAIFGDIKILKIDGLITIPVFIIATITFWNDPETGVAYYKILTLVTSIAIILCGYFCSCTIVTHQAEKLDYIYKSYKRQTELIEELKIDPLTKLYNRNALQETLVSLINRTHKKQTEPYLAILDLDFFKNVNDQFGHIAGDAVLITISDIIKEKMGSYRKAFRFGGEEFMLIFENTSKDNVTQIINDIRQTFSHTKFPFAQNKTFTLSAGISVLQQDDLPAIWIDRADKALYYAKTHGRDQIKFSE